MLERVCFTWSSGAFLAAGLLFAIGKPAVFAQSCPADWVPPFVNSGTNTGAVHASGAYDLGDGSGRCWYVGGSFTQIDGIAASRIARFCPDGANVWEPLLHNGDPGQNGISNGVVYAMEVLNGAMGPRLYVGGSFTAVGGAPGNRIASWDGGWDSVGSGVSSTVYALAVHDDGNGEKLFLGGSFSTAGGISANNVAAWSEDTTTYSYLGISAAINGVNGDVRALTVFDEDGPGPLPPALFVGGAFSGANNSPVLAARGITKWNGTAWSLLGTGIESGVYDIGVGTETVHALAVFDDGVENALYIGGRFDSIIRCNGCGTIPAHNIAKWNGTLLDTLVGGGTVGVTVDSFVYALAVFNDGLGPRLYAGGTFTTAGATPGANRVAAWNGATWSPLLNGIGAGGTEVYTLTGVNDASLLAPALYAAGDFTTANLLPSIEIARWGTCISMGSCNPVGLDCDNDGTSDSCAIANCPFGNVSCSDCQPNGVPDSCDIANGTSMDLNGDGIPDECLVDCCHGCDDANGCTYDFCGPNGYCQHTPIKKGDVYPCNPSGVGDGVCSLDDILAVLNCFSGNAPCGCTP